MWSKARGALSRFFLEHAAAADEGFAGGGGERDSGTTDSSSFAAKHRRFIVDLEAPAFDAGEGGAGKDEGREGEAHSKESCGEDCAGSACRQGHVQEVVNEEQRVALRRVLAAKDYVLLLGMPGTGKTTSIAAIVAALVARGSKVLLTSYTNTAVDNMLIKLNAGGKITEQACVRLHSRGHRTPPEIAHYVLRPETFASTTELRERMQGVKVVATTCHNVHHALLRRLCFDVCIVDEASQVMQPLCLAPLSKAQTFVLVGDHNQLPPLVVSREAQEMGMAESLFKRLSEAHPEATVTLRKQYRMNEAIMSLSNDLFDPEFASQPVRARLECANTSVSSRALHLSAPLRITAGVATVPWILDVMRGDGARGVVFVDTFDLAQCSGETHGSSNPHEALAVAALIDFLLHHGVPAADIAAVSPFKAQARMIAATLQRAVGAGAAAGCLTVEVDTVDRFQGRDKECVVLSLVSHNSRAQVCALPPLFLFFFEGQRVPCPFPCLAQFPHLSLRFSLPPPHFFCLFLSWFSFAFLLCVLLSRAQGCVLPSFGGGLVFLFSILGGLVFYFGFPPPLLFLSYWPLIWWKSFKGYSMNPAHM
jgi:DNA replication ATP-dependent helicase Dna2